MQIYEEIRKKVENHIGLFLIVFLLTTMLIYLGCECFYDFDGVFYYIYPAFINGLMVLSAYLTWCSYTKENTSVIVSILLSGIAVMLPLLIMLLLLILVVIFLWNWNQKDIFLNQC